MHIRHRNNKQPRSAISFDDASNQLCYFRTTTSGVISPAYLMHIFSLPSSLGFWLWAIVGVWCIHMMPARRAEGAPCVVSFVAKTSVDSWGGHCCCFSDFCWFCCDEDKVDAGVSPSGIPTYGLFSSLQAISSCCLLLSNTSKAVAEIVPLSCGGKSPAREDSMILQPLADVSEGNGLNSSLPPPSAWFSSTDWPLPNGTATSDRDSSNWWAYGSGVEGGKQAAPVTEVSFRFITVTSASPAVANGEPLESAL